MLKADTDKALQDDETKAWNEVDVKVESEQDVKEFKNETETEMETGNEMETEQEESKPELSGNNTTLADIDKFEPIESDEDETMCEAMEIKTEVDDSQDKSMEAVSYKHESISEDSKSQDDTDMPVSSNETKTVVNSEDFNIEDSKPEHEDLAKHSDSIIPEVLPENEIEDIQQKLHSFHSENLMILQTRNKKRASRATTPTLDETSPSNSNVCSKDTLPSASASTSTTTASSGEQTAKSRKFSVEDNEYKREATVKVQNDDESTFASYNPTVAPPPNPTTANHPPTASTHTYSSYTLNSAHRNEQNQSIPSAQLYQTPPPSTPTNFPTVNSQLASNMSTSNPLYHYLENPNRQPGFNAAYNAPPMFSIHTSVPPPTLLNSSNYLTKSYSTLSEPSTPVATVPTNVSTPPPSSSTSNTPINPKVLSRTQSADPRLNPQKDLPPVTPKRKLSINEYRKRKQLTNTTEKPKVDTTEKAESAFETDKTAPAEDKPKNGMSIADATKETGNLFVC